jgi:hypothetical protein
VWQNCPDLPHSGGLGRVAFERDGGGWLEMKDHVLDVWPLPGRDRRALVVDNEAKFAGQLVPEEPGELLLLCWRKGADWCRDGIVTGIVGVMDMKGPRRGAGCAYRGITCRWT